MKSSLRGLLVGSLFLFSIVSYGQSISDRMGRIPFDKTHHKHTPDKPIGVQSPELYGTAYGFENNSYYSFSIPLPEGTPFTWLFNWWPPYPYFASSMTNGPDGQYYVTLRGEAPNWPPLLYRFDPVTGNIFYNGVISGMGNDEPNGIAYNHNQVKYYIVSGTTLYLFDICNMTAIPVGPLNTAGGMIDICFVYGVCYGYDIFDDNAYTIDLSTGNATLLGPIGFDAEYGQGMSSSYTVSGTIYLSAYNNQTGTAQLRTMDPGTGMTTLVVDWGFGQIAAFAVEELIAGYPVLPASNPDPPPGAVDIAVEGTSLSWINHGLGTNESEVWLNCSGTPVRLYDGSLITSLPTGALPYGTRCEWRVNSKYLYCCSLGELWSFTTETEPALGFYDHFNNLGNWTAIGPAGTANWYIIQINYTGGANPPELVCEQNPYFNGLSRLMSTPVNTIPGEPVHIHFRQYIECADSETISGIGVTYDDGLTYNIIATNGYGPYGGHKGLFYAEFIPDAVPFRIILFVDGESTGITFIVDDLYVFNCPDCPPPYAPGSLSAQIIFNPAAAVHLNWEDISWNEMGFDIFRKAGNPNDPGEYIQVGGVVQNKTEFTDYSAHPESTYTYRVFSYNSNGSSGSETAAITLPIPVELISFTGEAGEGFVTVYWRTATETNNRGFEIQRADAAPGASGGEISSSGESGEVSGGGWERIGYIAGSGTTTKPVSYSFGDQNAAAGRYLYRLKQIDYDDSFEYSKEIIVDVDRPGKFYLSQNFPDPFNPATTIKYSLPEETAVSLKLYDILGNEVMSIVNGKQKAGDYLVSINLADLSSGVYIYRLTAGRYSAAKKMVLLR